MVKPTLTPAKYIPFRLEHGKKRVPTLWVSTLLIDNKGDFEGGKRQNHLVGGFLLLLGAHNNLHEVTIVENFLGQSLHIVSRYAIYGGQIIIYVVDTIIVEAGDGA